MSDAGREVYAAELCSGNECDTPAVTEVDDVVEGSEPGASRFSMLIPTDSYDDIAKFAASGRTDAAYSGRGLSHGTIEQLKDDTDSKTAESNSDRTVAVAGLQNERLKPPQPIFARIDTPTSLSEEEIERHRSSTAPAFSRQSDTDADQITVQLYIVISVLVFVTFSDSGHIGLAVRYQYD